MSTSSPAGTAAHDTSRPSTPAQAWSALLEGNERFVSGQMTHPSQDAARRAELSAGQRPFAVVLGCSDSRVSAEIVFDQGLGDLFVVRTAGHVVDTTVLGSIEYGVEVLGAPLVVVLGHESCGAVGAAAEALATGQMPQGFVRSIVERVIPSIVNPPEPASAGAAGAAGPGADAPAQSARTGARSVVDPAKLGRDHVRHTLGMLQSYSAALSAAVAEGRCAIVGLEYAMAEGRVRVVETSGAVDA